jgi:hypothetical protein
MGGREGLFNAWEAGTALLDNPGVYDGRQVTTTNPHARYAGLNDHLGVDAQPAHEGRPINFRGPPDREFQTHSIGVLHAAIDDDFTHPHRGSLR